MQLILRIWHNDHLAAQRAWEEAALEQLEGRAGHRPLGAWEALVAEAEDEAGDEGVQLEPPADLDLDEHEHDIGEDEEEELLAIMQLLDPVRRPLDPPPQLQQQRDHTKDDGTVHGRADAQARIEDGDGDGGMDVDMDT